MVDIKPNTIYFKAIENYNSNVEKLEHLYKAYILEIPVKIGKYTVYNPEELQEFFKIIRYNYTHKYFEFIINKNPEVKIRYYIKVTKCKNFIKHDKVYFELKKIEYYYSDGKEEYTIKIRKTYKQFNTLLKKYELLENIFNILNNDNSLEEIYNLYKSESKKQND